MTSFSRHFGGHLGLGKLDPKKGTPRFQEEKNEPSFVKIGLIVFFLKILKEKRQEEKKEEDKTMTSATAEIAYTLCMANSAQRGYGLRQNPSLCCAVLGRGSTEPLNVKAYNNIRPIILAIKFLLHNNPSDKTSYCTLTF